VHYCHKEIKVIHRDIKPENVMINHNKEAVLIDFGVSALVDHQQDDTLSTKIGSFMFYAPEMFETGLKEVKLRGERTDIWALGITLYFMACGRYPFEAATNPFHLKELVTQEKIDFSPIKNQFLVKLLQGMLEKNQEQRWTLEQILDNEWVNNFGKNPIDVTSMQVFKDGKKGFGNFQRLKDLTEWRSMRIDLN
jgi:serine/threonine protein kinase